jgi:hypothetical protein
VGCDLINDRIDSCPLCVWWCSGRGAGQQCKGVHAGRPSMHSRAACSATCRLTRGSTPAARSAHSEGACFPVERHHTVPQLVQLHTTGHGYSGFNWLLLCIKADGCATCSSCCARPCRRAAASLQQPVCSTTTPAQLTALPHRPARRQHTVSNCCCACSPCTAVRSCCSSPCCSCLCTCSTPYIAQLQHLL